MQDAFESGSVKSNQGLLQVLGDFSSLRELAPDLWADATGVDVFLTAEWYELLSKWGVAPGAQFKLLVLDAAQTPPLCLPLLLRPEHETPRLTGLSNFYTSIFGFVGMVERQNPQPAAVLQALGAAIRSLPGSSMLTLQPLSSDHSFLTDMWQALRGNGYWVDRFLCFGNWYLPCAGLSFASYLALRSGQLRNNVARGKRRLAKAGSWEIDICSRDGPELSRLSTEFESVYAASWKQAEARPEFISQLIRLAASRQWLRLGVLRLNGEAIAAQLWLVKAGRASIYKLAYREGYQSFSAGSVLTAALMERVLDIDRVVEVDYLTGDDAYKSEWMSDRRERWGLVAFDPRRFGGLVAAARHFGGLVARRVIKLVRGASAPAAN